MSVYDISVECKMELDRNIFNGKYSYTEERALSIMQVTNDFPRNNTNISIIQVLIIF